MLDEATNAFIAASSIDIGYETIRRCYSNIQLAVDKIVQSPSYESKAFLISDWLANGSILIGGLNNLYAYLIRISQIFFPYLFIKTKIRYITLEKIVIYLVRRKVNR